MKFKIMTWNVENLFRPDEGGPTADVFQQKLATLSGAIEALDLNDGRKR